MQTQKYIKIQSAGIIDPQAFTLIGASTKREDNTKIGFFGSGLKYSIAYLLRNKIDFKVFAEYKQITFNVETVLFREKEFSAIVIDGQKTNMTVEMGGDWVAWFVIREIYCNALDEGESSISLVNANECVPCDGKTVFYIAVTPAIAELVEKWDDYFCKDRKNSLYEDSKGNQLFGGSDTLIVYRKGIRCLFTPNANAIFHYNLSWVKINESRVITSEWDFQYNLRTFLMKMTDRTIVSQILNKVCQSYEKQLGWNNSCEDYSDVWAELIGEKTLVPFENAGFWQEYIRKDPHLYHILPSTMIEGLKTRFADKIKVVGDVDGVSGSGDFKPVQELSKRDQCLLNDSIEWLENADYKIQYPIKIVEFSKERVFGRAKDGTILLSQKLFEMGKRKIAAVIIEEQEHLITDFDDETREFQNHWINKYVSALEDRTGKYL